MKQRTRKPASWLVAGLLLTQALFPFSAAAAVPNDPSYAEQWYLNDIHLPEAWNFAKGSPLITVAVIDTGVETSHPDLKDRIWTNPGELPGNGVDDDNNGYVDDIHGWDFVDEDNDPNPVIADNVTDEGVNHGTLVAGIIGAAGNNGLGISGVNWNVRIMPLRVLNSSGVGGAAAVERAVRYAVAKKAKVINISFTGDTFSRSLEAALRDAHRAGSVIVAAAGNEGDTARGGNLNVRPAYPVCYKGAGNIPIIIGVAALDRRGVKSSFSNYGSNCVDIAAPGENFLTTQVTRYAKDGGAESYSRNWSGSSLSAPVVAGVAALITSMNPGFTPDQIRGFLLGKATDIRTLNGALASEVGAGKLDAAASVLAAQAYLLSGGTVSSAQVTTPVSQILGSSVKGAAFAFAASRSEKSTVVVLEADLRKHAEFEVFNRRYPSDLSVAIVDTDGDGIREVAVGAPKGEQPIVRVFSAEGALVSHFLAYDASFRGGVRVAAIDTDGDGKDELLTGNGSGMAPRIRIFDRTGARLADFAAGDAKDRLGLRVAAVDTDGDGKDEVVAASAGPKKPVSIFAADGTFKRSFEPFSRTYAGGLEIAAGDLDGDGRGEIVVGGGAGGPPKVSTFRSDGTPIASWNPFRTYYRGGVGVAFASAGGASGRILVTASTESGQTLVYTHEGTIEKQFQPFGKTYAAGVRPAGPRLLKGGK
jgi:subtilisin family serine protease